MGRPIAIVCAMDWELAHLRQLVAADFSEDWHHGQLAHVGQLDHQPMVLTVCGMGMVSAAAGTQHVISRYTPQAVVNYGCAGAHRAGLLPGDIVVGTQLIAYDNIRESADGDLRYGRMHYLEAGEQRHVDALTVDDELLFAAQRAAEMLAHGHEPWPADRGWPTGIPHRLPNVTFGTVVSADRWNRSPETIAGLVARHDSQCEDMEAAAMALVCATHSVPFISIKDISNNELLRPTRDGRTMLSEVGLDEIARRAAVFTLRVVQALLQARADAAT